MTPKFDIFISYAALNKEIAEALVYNLETHGSRCWIASRNIGPGSDYGEEIIKGIQNSVMFVLVFSAQSYGSKHVLREVDKAISFDKIIVPIKIDKTLATVGMDYRLTTVQWVESEEISIPDKTINDTLNVLVAAKQRELKQITPEYIVLNACSRCGAQYPENDPSWLFISSSTP